MAASDPAWTTERLRCCTQCLVTSKCYNSGTPVAGQYQSSELETFIPGRIFCSDALY